MAGGSLTMITSPTLKTRSMNTSSRQDDQEHEKVVD